jgi:hypothetical protein
VLRVPTNRRRKAAAREGNGEEPQGTARRGGKSRWRKGEAMRESEAVVERANRVALWYLVVVVVVGCGAAAVFNLDELRGLRVASVWVLMACMPLVLWPLVRMVRLGDADLPRLVFWGGCAFMVGGSGLDVGATIAHTPDLSSESNPVVRALLDSGHSLSTVYVVGGIAQAAFLLWGCLALAALLRHRRAVVRSAWAVGPRSRGEFVGAALTGRRLTLRQFLFSAKLADLPRAYYFASLLNLCTAPSWAYRWYLGLGWLDAVPPTPAGASAAAGVAMVAAVVAYCMWLGRQWSVASGQWPATKKAETDAGGGQ